MRDLIYPYHPARWQSSYYFLQQGHILDFGLDQGCGRFATNMPGFGFGVKRWYFWGEGSKTTFFDTIPGDLLILPAGGSKAAYSDCDNPCSARCSCLHKVGRLVSFSVPALAFAFADGQMPTITSTAKNRSSACKTSSKSPSKQLRYRGAAR